MKKIEINITDYLYDIIDNIANDFEKDIDAVIAGMIQYANDKTFGKDEPDKIILLEGYISGCSRFLRKEMGEDLYNEK